MAATLSKTRTILVRHGDSRVFTPESSEDDPGRDTFVLLDRDVFEDMGSPQTITVTVEPGDLLNP